MRGKFLIIQNDQYKDLIEEIIVFLWDNGNEVMVNENYTELEFSQLFTFCNTCIITVGVQEMIDTSVEDKIRPMKDLDANKTIFNSKNIHFSNTGVYTNVIPNAIPIPQKIFAFETLNFTELNCFFSWCKKQKLFS